VTILNRHNRARSLGSLAQGHFQWRKIIVTDALPHHHRCLRGQWHGWWRGILAHLIIAQHRRWPFLASFQPICNLFSRETRERDGSREQLIDWVIEAFSAAVSSLSPWGKVMHVRLIHNWAKHVWLVFIFPLKKQSYMVAKMIYACSDVLLRCVCAASCLKSSRSDDNGWERNQVKRAPLSFRWYFAAIKRKQ